MTPRRVSAWQLGLGACYVIASFHCAHILRTVPSLHPAWPAAGLGVGLALLGGAAMPFVIFACGFVATVAAGWPVADAVVMAGGVAALAAAGAYALRRAVPPPLRVDTVRAVAALMFVAVAGGMIAASARTLGHVAIGTLVVEPMYGNAEPLAVWLTIAIATAVGIMTVVPGVLAWSTPLTGPPSPWPAHRVAELVAHLAAAGTISLLLLHFRQDDNRYEVAGALLTYPLVAWAAVSFGRRGASAISFGLALLVMFTPSANLGVLVSNDFSIDLLRAQFFLASVSVTGLILAAAFEQRRRVERELAASELRTRTLIEHAPEGIIITGIDPYTIVSANRSAERMFGWSEAELVGKSPAMLSVQVQPDGRDRAVGVGEVIALALAGEEPHFEWTYRRRDGSTFPAEVRLVALPGGERRLMRVSVSDISVRKAAAQVDQAQRQVLEAIATGAPHRDILAQIVGLSEQQVLGSIGSILIVNAEGTALHHGASPSLPPEFVAAVDGLPVGPLSGACGSAAHAGELAVIDDVDADPRLAGWRPLMRANGIRALWSMPFFTENATVLGTLALYLHEARRPTPGEAQALAAMANLAGIAAQGQRAQQRLREAQEQLQHAQKMEAVGKLAGGIAHDFNNILTVILATSQLLLDEIGHVPQLAEDLCLIRDSAERAGMLTRQLLAFGRRQIWQPRTVDVNDVIARLQPVCERVLGAPIRLHLSLGQDVGATWIDEGQLEQVIVNLIVNARDAMPDGGMLHVSSSITDVVNIATGERLGVARGRYIELVFADTGTGMDDATASRIFEPFFTTKALGQGTGLGLATAYGIVRRAEGAITVESAPGNGTTFRLLLPWRVLVAPDD